MAVASFFKRYLLNRGENTVLFTERLEKRVFLFYKNCSHYTQNRFCFSEITVSVVNRIVSKYLCRINHKKS